jgi:hypothetical protein
MKRMNTRSGHQYIPDTVRHPSKRRPLSRLEVTCYVTHGHRLRWTNATGAYRTKTDLVRALRTLANSIQRSPWLKGK